MNYSFPNNNTGNSFNTGNTFNQGSNSNPGNAFSQAPFQSRFYNKDSMFVVFGPSVLKKNLETSYHNYFYAQFNYKYNERLLFEHPSSKDYSIYEIFKFQRFNNANIDQRVVLKNISSCSGIELDDYNNRVHLIITQLDIYNEPLIKNGMTNFFSKIFLGKFKGTLVLANLKQMIPEFKSLDFNRKPVLKFILFLCSKFCFENNLDVQVIDFRNNDIYSIKSFKQAKSFFPNLGTIIVEGNNITDTSFSFEKIEATGVKIQLHTGGFTEKLKHDPNHEENRITHNEAIPPVLIDDSTEEIESIEINPAEFPANPFLIEFLQTAKTDISLISKFYAPSATMSATSETGSDVAHYCMFSRNFLKGQNNFVTGPEDIQKFNSAIFGTTWNFILSQIQFKEVIKDGFLFILYGSFMDQGQNIVGYNRSLFIGRNEHVFLITNDQIHFRSCKK